MIYRLLVVLLGGFSTAASFAQRVEVKTAQTNYIPVPVDSNSPAFWWDGQLRIVTSTGVSLMSSGTNQFLLSEIEQMDVHTAEHLPLWIEAAWVDKDGTVFYWYHHEPGGLCASSGLTVPRIGAAVSYDGGKTLQDLGIVLESSDPVDCSARNGFFAGGHGDFSVILDREKEYFYFHFTNYGGDVSGQGVAVARMRFVDRFNPVGAVRKYFEGEWFEPGLGGRVTPIFPAAKAWQREDANSFWGPSIHWNTYLEKYVVLLNHACCEPRWPQEGIYVSFNDDLSDPEGWSAPARILQNIGFVPGYYPQVLGLGPDETDSLAGQAVRLYVQGVSNWELVFHKEALEEPPVEPVADPNPPPEL